MKILIKNMLSKFQNYYQFLNLFLNRLTGYFILVGFEILKILILRLSFRCCLP